MPGWKPILVLPNLDMRGAVESEHAAIAGPMDPRVQALFAKQSAFQDFLSRFRSQFSDEEIWPATLLLRDNAPSSYFAASSVSGFRDLVALAVVPYARSQRLIYSRPQALVFSNVFSFYPWMLDNRFEELVCFTPAMIGTHLLGEFGGQNSPEQPPATVMASDIDGPLIRALISEWIQRFSEGNDEWHKRALFRSLNMANEAARMPAITSATFYEFGRSLAIWVSAFEILVHPGGTGEANIYTVFDALNQVPWLSQSLATKTYPVGKKGTPRNLACKVYEAIYGLRNDFMHGNEVGSEDLVVGTDRRQLIDYAACLYRLLLSGKLAIKFPPPPGGNDSTKLGKYISDRMEFNEYQKSCEKALETFLSA